MPYYYTRICPICQKVGVQDISRHLRFAHKLSSEERKPYLKSKLYTVENGSNVHTNNKQSLLDKKKKKCDKPNDNTLNLKRKKVENVRESTMKKMKKAESERDITKESIVMDKDRFVINVWY